jgi:hypothetical protein
LLLLLLSLESVVAVAVITSTVVRHGLDGIFPTLAE